MQHRLKVAGSVAALAMSFAIGAGTGLQLQPAHRGGALSYMDVLQISSVCLVASTSRDYNWDTLPAICHSAFSATNVRRGDAP